MINLLDSYIQNSLPECGDFVTNKNLRLKVSPDGKLLPFFGNTTVFLLNSGTKEFLTQLQAELYSKAGDLFAQKLDPKTFHVTLHDLVNGPEPDTELIRRMTDAESKAREFLALHQGSAQLKMNATWLFNMVNTSVVLGLSPANEESWNLLDDMYNALETAVPLGYGLTPHITMAYYKPGRYSQQEIQKLKKALCPVALEITLDPEDLVYQEFTDMNHYVSR